MIIHCSTKVCSFGKQVVEKLETEHARYENGRYVYKIARSPMCEYMINFIHKLKHLPEKYMMNSVLENFTILQVNIYSANGAGCSWSCSCEPPWKYKLFLTCFSFLFQVIKNRDTNETLLCIAYVFEVSTSEHGAQHHIYKLVKD